MTIVAPTTVQKPPASKSPTTQSVSSSISTFTKKYAIPSVRTISGSASRATTGLTIQFATVNTAAASSSTQNESP
jgi:hypothetical protein